MPVLSNPDPALVTMAAGKKMLMYEWICYHLERNTFPEMKYLDESKTTFQVPWTHKSNRKWNENVAAVFKAWAKYKGKEENFTFTRAKTNFRMAMKYQPNIREVPKKRVNSDKVERLFRRKSCDEGKCVKVYEILQSDEVVKKKPKKATSGSSEPSDNSSTDHISSSVTVPSTPSPRVCSTAIQIEVQEKQSPIAVHHQPHQDDLDSLLNTTELSTFSTNETQDFFAQFLEENIDFGRLPPCHELLGRETSIELSRPLYGSQHRYIPLQPFYENASDMEVSSTDDSFNRNCSSEHSSDEGSSSRESFSLCSFYTKLSQGLETACQVTSSSNDIGDAYEYFTDIEAFERMEDCVEQLLVRSFG